MTRPFGDRHPYLRPGRFTLASPRTPDYNCIAFVAGDLARWWEPYLIPPPAEHNIYWPPGIGVTGTVNDYIAALATVGLVPCMDGTLDASLVKVALHADAHGPTHAARQLADGRWHSKLGDDEDIIHATPDELAPQYGPVVIYLARPRRPADP